MVPYFWQVCWVSCCLICVFKWFMSADKYHCIVWVFPLVLAMQQKCRMQILYDVFPQVLSGLLYTYLCTPLGADEVNGWSLQLINLFMMKVMIWGFVWVTFIRLWLQSTWLLSSYLLWHPSLQLQGNLCVVLAGFHFVCKIDSYDVVNLLSNIAVKWNFCCCFGFCWITDVPCGKMLIFYSP
jgi:hypothetical protein